MTELLTFAALDTMPPDQFSAALAGLFEHSPWVAEAVDPYRPFHTARVLHDAMMHHVRQAGPDAQRRLIAAHPELARQEAAALTQDSTSEQTRLGFDRLEPGEHATLAALNAAYRDRFGLPCIVALARHATRASVYAAIQSRLTADDETERATALTEIAHITEARLTSRLGRTKGALSLHALDTVRGGAAPGLAYTLHAQRAGVWQQLAAGHTNVQGRTDGPLLAGLDLEPGPYRVDYAVADYHRAQGIALPEPPFLDTVTLAFGIADPGAHYHVPLQFTPWSYAAYRGG